METPSASSSETPTSPKLKESLVKKIIVAGLAGAVTLFFWSFVSHEPLDWHDSYHLRFKNEDAVKAVIEEERVCIEFFYGMKTGLDPVLVHYYRNTVKICGKHVRLVPSRLRIEEYFFAICDDSWRFLADRASFYLITDFLFQCWFYALVSTAQDSNVSTSCSEGLSKFFNYRSLARSSNC